MKPELVRSRQSVQLHSYHQDGVSTSDSELFFFSDSVVASFKTSMLIVILALFAFGAAGAG